MMTKKDFNAIANAFARAADKGGSKEGALHMAAGLIAAHCRQSNPNFDRDRFMAACKLEG